MNTEYLFPMLLARGKGGGGGGSGYTIAEHIDAQTGKVTYSLTKDGVAVGDTIEFDGDGILVNDPSAAQGTTVEGPLNDIIAMIYERASATYNFTTFTELDINTTGKTLVQITNELIAKNLPQNTIVTGEIYTAALPFSGNGEAEVIVNGPAYWWTCKSLNVSPYSWNAITASSSWGTQGLVLDWTPSYVLDYIKGVGSGTTQNNLVKWGADGYTVADAGAAIETTFDGTSDAKIPTSKSIKTNVSSNAVLTGYTPGTSTSRQSIAATDTIQGAINKLENNASLDEAKTDRIKMDSSETQNYYMQNSTPSNPVNGDYWFNDDPLISSDITAMTGYAKASAASAISTSDTLNAAVGKLEYKADSNATGLITKQNQVLGSWTPGTATTHSTPAGTDTVLQALQKIDNNQRSDENNISSVQDSVNGREFTFTSGGNIATNVDVGATVDITPNPVGSWSYTVSTCNAGEVITINGQGGSTPRLWAFTDKDYKLISKSADGAGMTGGTVTAPTNAAYCIINSTTATLGFCGIYGVKDDISELQGKTTGMSEGGSNYITVGGIRVYVSSTAPTGARINDLWIGG